MSAAIGADPARSAMQEVLALTLWGEAAGRPVRALEAVAAVVLNRARLAAEPGGPAHWGRGVAAICRAPFQFPCWNPNHARFRAMREVSDGDPAFAAARRIAARALARVLSDPTGGATHYHDAALLPRWAIGEVPTAEIGGLVFYRVATA